MAHNLPFRLRPGLPIFADDLPQVRESWRPLLERGAETIYPAHGDPFPAEVMRKALASGMSCAPTARTPTRFFR